MASKVLLGAGALAAAITAILNLWPSPDPEDHASLSLSLVSQEVSLSEYKFRSSGVLASLNMDVGALPVDLVAVVLAETATAPAQTATVTPDPMPPQQLTPEQQEKLTRDVLADLEKRGSPIACDVVTEPPDCLQALMPLLGVLALEPDPTLAATEPAVAAERLVQLLGEVRQRNEPEGPTDPLGVVVAANLELRGLRGRPLLLRWSLWQSGGGGPLSGPWLKTRPAYKLQASTENDTGSVDLWIPLPKDPGPYVLRAELADGDTLLAQDTSDPFH